MPHIIVKMYAGKSDHQKKELTERIVKSVIETTECKDTAVSVSIEEFAPHDWADKVYRPDILERHETLFKKPGYNPFELKTKKQNDTPNLMEYVRTSAALAASEDTSGMFNPMAWLDLELEDNPQSFDPFFDTPWNSLSEQEQAQRMMAIRRTL